MEAKGDFRSQMVTVNFDSGSISFALHKTIAFVFTRGLSWLHMPAVLTVLSSPGASLSRLKHKYLEFLVLPRDQILGLFPWAVLCN